MNLESIAFAIIGAFLAYGALGCIVMLIRGLFLNDKESLSYRKYWHLLVGGFILCAGLSVSLLGQAYEDFFGKEDNIEKYNSNSLNFKGKCIHVDKRIPWNECDKCKLHKVYW